MDIKKIRKAFAYFIGWAGLSVCSLIVRCLPEGCLYSFAQWLGSVGFRMAYRQRKIALDSLRVAFGQERSSEEIEQIARDCFSSMAKSGVELIYLMERPERLKKRVQFIGLHYLTDALSQKNGVLLVSAHFGNFPLMLAKLSLEGYRVGGIMRPMKDPRVERLFLTRRNRLGIKTIYSIPRQACVAESIRCLRNNELVFIPLDQNFGTGGVYVKFFGRMAATATGPVVLAQRTKAPVLMCFIVRQADNTHRVIFEPIELTVQAASEQESLQVNVQKVTDCIEKYVKKYPAEWGWIHKRWKSQQ